jgi:hypothetical protein
MSLLIEGVSPMDKDIGRKKGRVENSLIAGIAVWQKPVEPEGIAENPAG